MHNLITTRAHVYCCELPSFVEFASTLPFRRTKRVEASEETPVSESLQASPSQR